MKDCGDVARVSFNIKKVCIFLGLVSIILLVYATGWHHYFSSQGLQQSRTVLQDFVTQHYLLAVGLYISLYIALAFSSLPGATASMTMMGGLLFGVVRGVIYAGIGATIGAVLVFLASRYLVGDWVQKRFKDKLKGLNKELAAHGISYILAMRITTLFPYFLLNILLGLTQISLFTFVWTTGVGILPSSFVYAYAGKELGNVASGGSIFSINMVLALLLLGFVVMAPALKKKWLG